jgi:succinoglycan biosynthesis transport protein ExoP
MMTEDHLPLLSSVEPDASLPAVYKGNSMQLQIPQQEEGIHLLDYWRIIVKRKWIILLCFVATIMSAFLYTMRETPIYKASATLLIEMETPNILPYQDMMEVGNYMYMSPEFIQTQCSILQSKSLATRVAHALRLGQDPRFQSTRGSNKNSTGQESVTNRDSEDDTPYSAQAGIVLGGLEVQPLKDSHLIQISYNSPDPSLAQRVINTLAEEFIQAAQQATEFLKKQLTQLKAKLEKSEENLINYARVNDIMVIGEQQDVVLQKLSELNAALTEAQTERIRKESVYRIVKSIPDPIATFPSVLRNGMIEDLEKRLSGLKQDYARQGSKFKSEWPAMQEVQNQIDETERQLQKEKQLAVTTVVTDYETSLKRENLLQDAFDNQKVLANKIKESLIQYNILQREVDTNKNVYEGMLTRLKEASVAAGLKSSNIRIVDRAEVPGAPFKPNPVRNMMMAVIIGLLLGVGLAFFVEYLDHTVKTPDQVEQLTALPALGLIPAYEAPSGALPKTSKKVMSLVAKKAPRNGHNPVELIAHDDPTSALAEAFRSLRTSILLSNSDTPPHTFIFTSPRPEEGKTTAAINSAISFAQAGKRVVLLDLDMRKPRVHSIFDLDNKSGMSSFLAGHSDLSPLLHPTHVENLFVVPSGPIPPNPAELLSSLRMRQALELLREYFDHVIIDSPPLLSVTDSRILSRITDGVILVIRSGETPKQVLRQAQKNLQLINAHILGVLVNAADLQSADYYYYSKYYYYHYYEEGTGRRGSRRHRNA